MAQKTYDLVVIGGGPAGTSGALAASAFGKKVALVEVEKHVGGAGLNTGTVPSKALRESALVISGWRARKLLGVDVTLKTEATIADFTRHEVDCRTTIRDQLAARLQQRQVDRVQGHATFVDPHTVSVIDIAGNKTLLTGEAILIATGSSPVRPPEFPFEHPRVHDSNEILDIVELPKTLAVVGAGVIGSEYACTFAALGVEVDLIDGRDTLLPFLDDDISKVIYQAMEAAGVRFHWKERVLSCVTPPAGGVELSLSSGKQLFVTDVLVAGGRYSNTDKLNLEVTGVVVGTRGLIPVNESFQSCVPHIYAAGDVIGAPALAATGMEQARIAVCHAFSLYKKTLSPVLPTGIYTIPEAAMVGQTEDAVRESGVPYIVGVASYCQNHRGQLIGDENGFLKLIFRKDDWQVLGVHAVGEQATELVHIGMMAMLCGANGDVFNRACFNYPTLGDLYKHATYDAMMRFRMEAKQSS